MENLDYHDMGKLRELTYYVKDLFFLLDLEGRSKDASNFILDHKGFYPLRVIDLPRNGQFTVYFSNDERSFRIVGFTDRPIYVEGKFYIEWTVEDCWTNLALPLHLYLSQKQKEEEEEEEEDIRTSIFFDEIEEQLVGAGIRLTGYTYSMFLCEFIQTSWYI